LKALLVDNAQYYAQHVDGNLSGVGPKCAACVLAADAATAFVAALRAK
jgi:hypothetical protein